MALHRLGHTVTVAILALAVAACGNGGDSDRAPTPTDRLSGVYDADNGRIAVVSGSGSSFRLVIGSVAETAIEVSGTIRSNGSIDLTGKRHNQDIVGPPITGQVVVTESAGEIRIAGTIDGSDITLTRPADGIPRRVNGVFSLDFNPNLTGVAPPSRVILVLDPAADGRAAIADSEETDAEGREIGRLSQGICLVSPTYRLGCRFRYDRTSQVPFWLGGLYDVVLTGQLTPFEDLTVFATGNAVATNVPPITTHVVGVAAWMGSRIDAFE